MRTEFVRSVMSKHKTAPPLFWMVRLVTATTSPSTATRPDSRLRVFMGTGFILICRPMRTFPVGLEKLELMRVSTAAALAFTRGYSGRMATVSRL